MPDLDPKTHKEVRAVLSPRPYTLDPKTYEEVCTGFVVFGVCVVLRLQALRV